MGEEAEGAPEMTRNRLPRVNTGRFGQGREADIEHRIVFLDSVFLLAGVVAFGMGFIRWQASPVMGMIDFVFAGLNFTLLVYLHRHRDQVEMVSTVALILCFILFFAIYLLAPYNTTRLSLFFLLSASAFFLKGRRIGRYWLAIIILAIVAAHLLAPARTAYAHIDILTTCIYLFAMFVIFENYETFRERQQEAWREQEILRLTEERWRLALEGSGDAIWDWDIRSDQLSYSRRFAEMLGYGKDELEHTRSALLRLVHPRDAPRAAAALEAYLYGGGEQYATEQRLLCRDGNWKWILSRGKVTHRDGHGRPLRMSGTHTDITDRKRAEDDIRHLAYFDPLTLLPNRRLLMDRLGQALIASNRSREFGALMILDLDHFKRLNDSQGHDVGDRLLVEVAQRLTACVRQQDTVSRLGGDEYVVMLEGLGQAERIAATQAAGIAEKIRAALDQPYALGNGEAKYFSTTSIGLTLFHGQDDPAEALLKQADVALYQAKDAGRNTVRFFNPAR